MARIIAWALAALLLGVGALAATSVPHNTDEEVALVNAGLKSYDAKNWPLAAEQLRTAADAPDFPGLTPDSQWLTQRVLADAAYNAGDYQTSARAARAATQFEKSDGDDWYMRVWASLAVEDKSDAIESLTILATRFPKLLAAFRLRTIGSIFSGADGLADGEKLQVELLRALIAASWSPSDQPANSADWMWLHLVRYDLANSFAEEANTVAARIASSDILRQMKTEKIFDAIIAASPARYDEDKALDREIAENLKRVAEKPDLLEPAVAAADSLYMRDRQDEALALVDPLLAKAGTTAFKDAKDQLNWLHDMRARVLLALGRRDEAIAELALGAANPEGGSPNVSQVINLAGLYNSSGRPGDALAMLAKLGSKSVSPFGRMEAETERGCANLALKNADAAKQAFSYMDAHAEDDVDAAIRADFCRGDLDGAARLVIAQLEKPAKRSSVIALLQVYAKPARAVPTAMERKLNENYVALRNRADVQKALAPYGRILRFKAVRGY